jgi:hypothetical protein
MLDRLAVWLTKAVGTMWCALAFALLALAGLPAALKAGSFVAWLSQTFIQLVMLSVIMVGQRLQDSNAHARHTEQLQQHDHTHLTIHKWLLETITDDTSDD